MVEELGIEPGKALQDLHAAILRQDPALEARRAQPKRAAAADGAIASRRGLRRPRSGAGGPRGGARRRRDGTRERVPDPRGTRHRQEPPGGRVGGARPPDRRAGPLGPLLGGGRRTGVLALGAVPARVRTPHPGGRAARSGRRRREVAHLVPELRERLPDLPVLESPDSEGARFRLFDATASFLTRAAAQRPLLLVLEDLHAADTPSLLLLQFVAGEIAGARILVVGTYRDIELAPTQPGCRGARRGGATARRQHADAAGLRGNRCRRVDRG